MRIPSNAMKFATSSKKYPQNSTLQTNVGTAKTWQNKTIKEAKEILTEFMEIRTCRNTTDVSLNTWAAAHSFHQCIITMYSSFCKLFGSSINNN